MFRIVICEDDLSQRELLKGFLYKVFEEIQEDLDLIEFESGEEALLEEVILKDAGGFMTKQEIEQPQEKPKEEEDA